MSSSTHHQGSSSRPSPALWFTTEIQQMMHGMGDCRRPLLESASLIEGIVRQHMVRLLYQSEEVARQRGSRFITIEDFLFLLRKDKNKLRRLLKCMELKDIKATALKAVADDEEQQEPETKLVSHKRRKICHDFLGIIDQTGELLRLFDDNTVDEVKKERALRAELQTRHMDPHQYMEFCQARQASFTPRYKTQRLKDWLMQGVTLEVKPNQLGLEVLSYLAYEIVAQIVDLALLVKRDCQARLDDPFSQLMPAVCINHDSLGAFQGATPPGTAATTAAAAQGKSPGSATSGTKVPSSPSSSPQSTPVTPTSTAATTPTSHTKSKSKKRKKSGMTPSRDIYSSQALQPQHVREAIRRYTQSIGPFADFSKEPSVCSRQRILCA